MKKIYLVFASLYLICFSLAMAQASDPSIQNTRALLGQIATGMKEHSWDKPGMAIEVGSRGLQKIPAFVELQKQVGTTWPQIISNIQSVAPSEGEKVVILMAFESSLSSDNYLQFVDQVVGLVENKTLDKQFLLWALFPSDKNTREVFSYNYDKPVVKDILQRVKTLYADKPNIGKFCDSVLSGGAKNESEDYHKDNPAETKSTPASK